jgi:RHS repeat-associated protein
MPQGVSYPDGTSESFVYNERGDMTSQTNRRGKTTTYQYNDRRQITQTTNPDTGTVINTYDDAGNLLTVTDPEGNVTRYTYSPQGKVLTETTAYGTAEAATITHTYDARDWRIRTTDSLNRVTQFEHDAAGRVIKVIDPLDRETTFTYDADGNRTSVTTPEGITTEFDYNERGERTTLTDPADNTVNYTHNAFGEQIALNNRRSQTFEFTFDDNGNLLTTTTPLGSTTTLAYNDLNQVESIEEASGQATTFDYDDAGRVESLTDAVGTITTAYDNNGNPLTLTEGSDVLTRTYDDMDRVATYTDAAGNEIEYTYFKNGLLKTLKYPDDKTVTYAYDGHNRLKTVTDWSNRVTSYTWDSAGRLTGVIRPNGTSRTNQYTDANELDSFYEYAPGQSALHAYTRFGYDDDSRIDWRYRIPEPQSFTLPSFDATYDSDNRVATWNTFAVNHDADGNMTTGPLPGVAAFVSYNFDARNRLTSVNGTSYQYDAEGNRIGQTDISGNTSYAIDPHGDALPRVLMRTKPDGTITHYVYGIGLLYEVSESDVATYYHFDQSGSTVALTDASGGVTDRVEYSPFGTITYRTGTTDTPYLYAGQFGIQQEGNGLLCMRARYYSPELQRFINADPIGFAGGLNWYQYAAGNPIMYGDPSGNSPALLLIPLIWWGTTQTANAPGPGDRTTNDTPFVAPASMALGVGPTVAASRTSVRSSLTAGRGFMNTLTGPATRSAVRNAGTMSFEAGNAGLSLMTQAGTQATTNALRQFASQALSYGGVYTAGTFVGGGITGLLTPTDASSLFPSGNPLMAPFEAGNLAGSFVGNTYNAVSEFFAQPVSTNFK